MSVIWKGQSADLKMVEEEGEQMFDKKIVQSCVEKISKIPCNASMGHTCSNKLSSSPQMMSLGEKDMPVTPNQISNAYVPVSDVPRATTDAPTASSHTPLKNKYIPLSDNALISMTKPAFPA
eukprot:9196167-Ditylum_brightwellii.AAC.1